MPASTVRTRRVSQTLIKPEYSPASKAGVQPAPLAWYRTTWFLALASSVALWLPLSPLNAAPLAWIAPVGWLLLIREEKLTGKRPYGVIYLAGLAHWLLVLEGIRRAYWALYLGWFALAAYLAVYLLLFVGLSRVAVHRLRVPLCVAAPLIWVGLEFVRGYALSGFSLGMLGHTQTGVVPLLQVADLGGAHAVSFVVMFFAAALVQALPWWFGARDRWPLAALVALVVGVFGYGYWRMSAADAAREASGKSLKVVLLQNSIDTVFGAPSEVPTYQKYLVQAANAAREHPDSQLMVWPESVFTSQAPDFLADKDAALEHVREDDLQRLMEENRLGFATHAQMMVDRVNVSRAHQRLDIAHIVGTVTFHLRNNHVDTYNSALLLDGKGQVQGRYHKQHLVMFGEYIPFGEMFPIIYKLTPMPGGLSRGKTIEPFEVAGYKLAPSICFESTVPHSIRRQVRELEARGESPDMLVNVTNDGWFWGSGILDLHYKCAVFRAIEHRRPMLVAANTGFSTAIDPTGRALAVGPRRDVRTLAVAMPVYRMTSFYSRTGDLFGIICMTFTGVCAGVAFWNRWSKRG